MITITFLAGGGSHRMGSNKAMKPFLGVPLIQRLAHRFEVLGYPMLVVTNEPDAFHDLSIPTIGDVEPGHGELGGLLTALTALNSEHIAVIACDMPFADPDLLKMEIELAGTNKVDAVVPTTYLGYEPFHAVYRRESCLQYVRRYVSKGERKMIAWFDEADILELPIHHFDTHSEKPELFYNMNTPADWMYAEQIAKNKGMQWGELA